MKMFARLLKWDRDGTYDKAVERLYAKKLCLREPTERTIVSGVIAPTQAYHTVDTESDAATDDLDIIKADNFSNGDIIIIRPENDARTIVVKHNTGNIKLTGEADVTLDNDYDTIVLLWTGSAWIKI